MGGTRPADRPASAGRWGRQASTDHSHEDGEGAVDAVLFTVQDPRTARHRRVPTAHDQRQRQKTAKHEMSKWGLDNPNEVWYAADRPYGLIEASIIRDDLPPAPEAWLGVKGFI